MTLIETVSLGDSGYRDFVDGCSDASFSQSTKYLRLLQKIFGYAPMCWVARPQADEALLGVLPAMIISGPHGPIANALPFFGSYGGPLAPGAAGIGRELVRHFFEESRRRGCLSATLICSPLDSLADQLALAEGLDIDMVDRRIGQWTTLPAMAPRDRVEDELMGRFHGKTRNMVRKAQKGGMEVRRGLENGVMTFLKSCHRQNMADLDGVPKPAVFFEAVGECFEYNNDFLVFSAWLDGAPISALLVFFYNGTVEYFMPVTLPEHRFRQPLSLLILEAMVEGVRRGCHRWNWGGTWLSQEGVYRFKSRWGATDREYLYLTRIFDRRILDLSRTELAAGYPYVFAYPFGAVASSRS